MFLEESKYDKYDIVDSTSTGVMTSPMMADEELGRGGAGRGQRLGSWSAEKKCATQSTEAVFFL